MPIFDCLCGIAVETFHSSILAKFHYSFCNAVARGQGDERGCFAAYLDTPGRSARERAFINALTGRPDEFVVISKSGEIASFDGRRPSTSQVLELKDPRDETRNYIKTLTEKQLNRWDQQKAKELRVADACGYQLIGITSNRYFTNFLNRRWKGKPPYYYIKAPNIQGLIPPTPLPPPDRLTPPNPCEGMVNYAWSEKEGRCFIPTT